VTDVPSVSTTMLYCTGGPALERARSKTKRIDPTPRGISLSGPAAHGATVAPIAMPCSAVSLISPTSLRENVA
jgi:hypothetical protein